MSKTINVKTPQEIYDSFMDIYPEFRVQCCGFNIFNWEDNIRKILINLNNIEVKILFSVRKSGKAWNEYSALLIPAPEKPKEPDPDENAEVDISEDL